MESFFQDARYAFRKLSASPGFALLTVVTLALGIGANCAIFSVVNGVILRPLAYPEPGRLTFITSQFPSLGFDQFWVSAPEFLEFRDWNRAFESVGAYSVRGANLGTDQPSRPTTALVTSELMPTLGVLPRMGRLFTLEDTLPGAEDVAILSEGLWRSSFNADPAILDRTVKIDGLPTRIVGVMPRGYDIHGQKVELWLPLTINPQAPGGRGSHFLYLVGRLKTGTTMEQARGDLERLLASWQSEAKASHAPDPKGHRLRFDNLQDDIVGNVKKSLWVLQGAVGFVLLIACANLANLLLARADSRRREFAVRAALGASRLRMLGQFVTEGIVIAVLGGILGVGLAFVGLRALLRAYPDSVPRSAEVTLDWRVLVFTLVVALITGVVFGLAPLLHLREQGVDSGLNEGGTRTTAGTARARTRNALVMSEVALAVVLVVGAGLLLRSFWELMRVDGGFDRTRLTTFGLVLPDAAFPGPERKVDVFTRLIARVERIPGVQRAAAMTGLPPRRSVNANDTDFEGIPRTPDRPIQNVDYYNTVTIGYVEAMKVPILAGRGFQASDATGPPVALINQALARKFFPDTNPVGRRMRQGSARSTQPFATIVGIVKDLKQGGLDAAAGTEVFFLAEQGPPIFKNAPSSMNLAIRSALPFETLAPQLRAAVAEIDTSLPIVRMRTMEDVFEDAVQRPRFMALLLITFASLALLLAAVGTYGILSYIVTERRREIGIRMALGADRGSVLQMVLRQGLTLTGIGLAAGIAASFLVNRALASLLFNVEPNDPATLAGVAGIIALVALLACLIPARSATRVDPIVVLRQD
jgi:putative ABC transport system permease protein